jgi:phage antirepressor YoqD-like protein
MPKQPLYTIKEVAAFLGLEEMRLREMLYNDKLLSRDKTTNCILPHARYVREGLFKTDPYQYQGGGVTRWRSKTLVTNKGFEYIKNTYAKDTIAEAYREVTGK